MEITVKQGSLTEATCDVLVVNLFEGVTHPGGGTGAVDRALGGAITELIADENFEGKLGQTALLHTFGKIAAKKVVIVGLGKSSKFGMDEIRVASSAAAKKARDLNAKKISTILHGAGIGGMDPRDCARALVEGAVMGTWTAFGGERYKTFDKKPSPLELIEIVEMDAGKIEGIREGAEIGQIFAEAVNFARDLIAEPANVATPTYLAETAKRIAEEVGLKFRLIDKTEAERLGMGAFLAVARGSAQPPTVSVLKYEPPGAKKTVAIVGKGITFDTGGLNLKPREGLATMKEDMAGAAAVLAVMQAVGKLKPKTSVIGIVPATENMPGANASRPSDVVTSLSGKTVEINDMDAEGRVILADAVALAVKEGAQEIVDVATLTGGCVVALGRGYSGLFGNDEGLLDRVSAAARISGEKLWRLPLPEEYQEFLRSDIADIKNHAGREASPIMGAMFISNFVGDTPWAHIDIAGTSYLEKESGYNPKGGTGAGTRTLLQLLTEV